MIIKILKIFNKNHFSSNNYSFCIVISILSIFILITICSNSIDFYSIGIEL